MRTISRGYGVLALAGLLSATGCLQKELTHTIYVSPHDVTWSAMEKDVRSDDPDPGTQMMEEQDYILGARVGQHGVARAFRALDASRVDTTVLRRERPFTVVTDAHFVDLAGLANAMMRAAHIRGDATMERKGCETTFRASLDTEGPGDDEATTPLTELMSEATSYRIVLTSGRFVHGDGFTIEKGGAIAIPGAPATAEDDVMRVSLTWTEGWCAPEPRIGG